MEEWCWWDGEYEWTVGSGVTTLRARCSGATHLAHTFLSDVGWLHDALLCGTLILGLERHTRQYSFEIWMEHPVDSKCRYLYVSMYFICYVSFNLNIIIAVYFLLFTTESSSIHFDAIIEFTEFPAWRLMCTCKNDPWLYIHPLIISTKV